MEPEIYYQDKKLLRILSFDKTKITELRNKWTEAGSVLMVFQNINQKL